MSLCPMPDVDRRSLTEGLYKVWNSYDDSWGIEVASGAY
jgi:hypothetical protein